MKFCDFCDKLAEYLCLDTYISNGEEISSISCYEHKCRLCRRVEDGIF